MYNNYYLLIYVRECIIIYVHLVYWRNSIKPIPIAFYTDRLDRLERSLAMLGPCGKTTGMWRER